MTPDQLKAGILQLAIQGKLVPQRPEEGTAEELYKEIQREKKKLLAQGKIKKQKPLPPISEDEIPFDIPETWKWVRLADLVVKEIKRGKSPTYAEKSNVLVFAQKCNVKAGGINMSLARRLDEKKFAAYPESELMQDADIVVNSTGEGTLGRVGIFHFSDNPEGLPIVPDSHVTIIRASSLLNKEWLFYYLKAHQAFFEKAGAGSTKQTELRAETLKALLIALPPLAEQQRIVAKIEQTLPLIERYGEAYTALETLDKRFPQDMRKSILQYAIQGKLVPQRPEEGTAEDLYKQIQQEKKKLIAAGKIKKEKPLPPIKEDEIPFDIPETWRWVRLADLVVKEIKRGKSPTYAEKSNVLVFAQKCNVKAGGINMSLARRLDEKKFAAYPESELMQDADIVVNSTGEGTLGRVGIFHFSDNPEGLPIVPDSHVTIIRASSLLNKEWLFYYLKAHQAFFEKAGAGSTKQTELRAETLKLLLVALPSRNEQNFISGKINELIGN
ncbi:MAG: restriction endonuclease subunit S [Akkermansia sp.]|nr:restriction endonuclease subunit S [Akkermansia sp.]